MVSSPPYQDEAPSLSSGFEKKDFGEMEADAVTKFVVLERLDLSNDERIKNIDNLQVLKTWKRKAQKMYYL